MPNELDQQVADLREVYEQRLKTLFDCASDLMRAKDAWGVAHDALTEAFEAWITVAERRAIMEEQARNDDLDIVTVTVLRGEEPTYLSVELSCVNHAWLVNLALDEDGNEVQLTTQERSEAIALAESGVDETGRDE